MACLNTAVYQKSGSKQNVRDMKEWKQNKRQQKKKHKEIKDFNSFQSSTNFPARVSNFPQRRWIKAPEIPESYKFWNSLLLLNVELACA